MLISLQQRLLPPPRSPSMGNAGLCRKPDRCAMQHFITCKGDYMNWDRIKGHWKQAKGRIREQWGKLTDDHLEVIAGRHDKLLGALQTNYGLTREGKDSRKQHNEDSIRRITGKNADLIGR